MLSSFIAFLKTKEFRKHVLIAAATIALLLFILIKSLDIYTRHGESNTVPNLKGMTLDQAMKLLADKNFKFEIDSVYSIEKPHGTIMEQDPDPETQVKEGRTIYLSIVSMIPPHVKVPDLKDVSLREATAILESYGLKVGELIYKPDLAQNAVLALQMAGQEIKTGESIPKGSIIDLVLGDGYGNTHVKIPKLVGLTYEEAVFVLQGSSLNVGRVSFDANIKDTTAAGLIVYKQIPSETDTLSLSQGEPIDLFIKKK